MKHVNLEQFANGEFTTQVNRALEQVTDNIQDPNTDAVATRKITVTITFKPNEPRNFVATGIVTKAALAPTKGTFTHIAMGRNLKTGELEAQEIGNQIPGQLSINDLNTEDKEETVSEEQTTNNVVDLRTIKKA